MRWTWAFGVQWHGWGFFCLAWLYILMMCGNAVLEASGIQVIEARMYARVKSLADSTVRNLPAREVVAYGVNL